ncbi:condensin subunit Cnd3-like protein [Lasiosphaeria miniovina]|uniref:Condensin subunit Cnd3-like protein n=1 Tax=Lasiosphaeria miniovina TaxID=1954250 RepID=A0AA40AWA6_9PEZI|nr:condensin subunit Cnd3-like protein [Lasiosphaeria miniovina]KAK0723119.1 condensin subunit Cnd3-like protein [Lasiosphaeria miniovina]
MPARTSRSTRTSAATVLHKPSLASLNPRASTASRASSVAHLDVPQEAPDNALRTQVATVFREAQRTTASHRKLAVTLRKTQEACCYEPTGAKQSAAADFDEDDFNAEFIRCVLRVMPVKKSEGVGEKTIRFIGLFLRYSVDKDNEVLGEADEDASTMPETPGTRLTNRLIETVVPLLTAKDKFVRYRSTQLIAHIINSLDAIDNDVFQKLRSGMLKRIHDKEAMVRAQAVLGLGRLAGNEIEAEPESEESDGGDNASGLLQKLLEVMQNDPSADVRKSLLGNLPVLPKTLPVLLERARDQDALTRRAVYSRLLPALGDFRHLSLTMREKLLRWGLRDRDENVRKAAGRLFRERWIEDCAGTPPPTELGQPIEVSPPTIEALLELLERIDVVNSGVENGVALEAMKGFWEGRPDYREAITFDDHFWETLSAESVFCARTFNDFCRNSESNGRYESLIEEKLPEVTKVAFYLERYIKVLIDAIKEAEEKYLEGDEEEQDDDTVEQEFIVEQLLQIALTLDYSDEVGRRKMFSLLRQTLSIPELPDEVTKLTVGVLRDICAPDAAGEKEFCSIVLEAVADVHDTILDEDLPSEDADESFHSAKSEVSTDSTPTKRGKSKTPELSEEEAAKKAIREIMINMKCLHIVQCMLSNVAGDLQQNDSLIGMLNNLVVPAVRSHEAPVRERGLVCLGLCSLLDRSLAEENLSLFMHFFSKGHTALQITALHILTDILNVHGAQLLSSNPALLKVYIKALRSAAKAPEVQAAATVAVSKLLLGRVVTDHDVLAELLKTLLVAYFEPASSGNQSVRQALNYFLPVFCYSRPENQDLLRCVALDALHALYNVREGLDDDDADVDEEMVSLSTIGACLVDWTDPRKCFSATSGGGLSVDGEKKNVNGDVHLDFAKNIIERLGGNASKEEKKIIAALLGKLYISTASSEDKIRDVYGDVCHAVDTQLLADATSRNALYKIHVSLGKIVNNLDAAQEQQLQVGNNFRRSVSRSTSLGGLEDNNKTVVPDDKTALLTQADIKEEEEGDEGSTVMNDATVIHKPEDEDEDQEMADSLVDDLLTDDNDA